MTDVWFIFNNQGNLSFITENKELANTNLLSPELLPGVIVKNPVGYDPCIDQNIFYDIENNSINITNNSFIPPVSDIRDLGSLYKIVNSLDLQLEELGNRITNVENELCNRITSVENTANLNSSTILTISDTVNLILSKISNLDQNVSTNNITISNLEQNVSTNNIKISNLEQNVNSTGNSNTTVIETDIENLKIRVQEIESTLENTLIV